MGTEIERKFLLRNEDWRADASRRRGAGVTNGKVYRQGYLSAAVERNVRVRIIGEEGYLTVKGRASGITRLEFEYQIPLADAEQMLDELCLKPLIEKTRFLVEHSGLTWEIDEFAGDNSGLVVAEVELDEEAQEVELPAWIGREVTDDPRYLNSNLVKKPYTAW